MKVRDYTATEAIRPFDSLESALEFMVLLEEVIGEASMELRSMLETPNGVRCRMGLDLAVYKLQKLSASVQGSRRLLNDLLMIRRVLAAQPMVEEKAQSPFEVSEAVIGGPARSR